MEKDMSRKTVFTIGYEGEDIETFLSRLLDHDIKQVIDVREIPLSRKKGFSKTILREQLAQHDIDYVHMRELGSPSLLRKKLYRDGDFDYFFKRYEEYLEKHQRELEELYEVVTEKLSCLLCFEKDASNCHRRSVADKINSINGMRFRIEHI